jgi:tetratricopeptide (TPR) repeat protein
MARSADKFAQLLTEGIYRISLVESKSIAIVQDELGYALGKKGGSSIEHWRKRHLPAKLSDVETLARKMVARGKLERTWLEQFLHSFNHPAPERLCDELFSSSPLTVGEDAAPPTPASTPDFLPLDRVPLPASLPAGSLMPLRKNPLFVGRDQDLRAIAAVLRAGGAAAVSQVETAATTGLGGIGKTQLACEFVHRYGQYFRGGVFWLSFADPQAVAAEIAACGGTGALELRPDFGHYPLHDQVRLVQAAWQRSTPRLLVFDNCEDPELLERWRPVSGGCSILVTSRRGNWEVVLGVKTLALGVLPRVESLNLLWKYYPEADEEILDAIAEELGDLPLALHLAGSYLYRYRRVVNPDDYLKQLRDPHLLRHPSLYGDGISPTGHVQHVGRTFALSYDRLDPTDEIDTLALDLLVRTAHFAPGEPIWYRLLVKTLGVDLEDTPATLNVDRAFARLIELGLIETEEEEDDVLRMHRLVAAFVREVAKDKVETTQRAVETVVFEETAQVNREGRPLPLLAWQLHLRAVVDVARARADEEGARLCNELGQHLWQIGDYEGALPYYAKALAIRESVLGKEHLETAQSLLNMGRLLRAIGKLGMTRSYFEQALAIRKQRLGERHSDTAECLDNLGRCLHEQGNLAEALPLLEEALAINCETVGEADARTAEFHNNVGMCLVDMGEGAQALHHLKQALAINEKMLGSDHPHVALSNNNIGVMLRNLGRLEEAKPYYERALQIRQTSLGVEHPDTGQSLNNLGTLLRDLGHLDKAQEYIESGLHIYETVLGAEHPRTAFCHRSLGRLYLLYGDTDRAKMHLARAFSIRQETLGPDHPLTVESRGDIEGLQQAQQK